jgi:hypothetical protein
VCLIDHDDLRSNKWDFRRADAAELFLRRGGW